MMYCPECGTQIDPAPFCRECGVSLTAMSGMGARTVIPPEIKGWNWGAFLLGWIWGAGNNVWITLLEWLPLGFIIMRPILGVKGNKWAWQHKEWRSISDFKRSQRNWIWGGLVIDALFVLLLIWVYVIRQ